MTIIGPDDSSENYMEKLSIGIKLPAGTLWTRDLVLVLGCGVGQTQEEEARFGDPSREAEVPTA